jgi:2-methylisocitrate lyase-like PEP mutase family enzyme
MRGYAAAGLAGIMLEDQVSPKRCGHTKGKDVVSFDEAVARVKAAVRARESMRAEQKGDLVIVARTDAAAPLGMDEARKGVGLTARKGCLGGLRRTSEN